MLCNFSSIVPRKVVFVKKYFCSLVVLCFVPNMAIGNIWYICIGQGWDKSYHIYRYFPETAFGNVVPWGLKISICGKGNRIGTNWLWLAIQKWPDGKIMFLMPDGRLSKKPIPFCSITGGFLEEFCFETPRLEITSDIREGFYIVSEIMTYSPNNVLDKSNWAETSPSKTYIFIRRELNRHEWESQGWTIWAGPGI